MTEDLQHDLASTIANMQDAVSGAKDFAIEQAPLVVQEFIHWMVLKNSLLSLLAVIWLAITVRIARWLCERWVSRSYPIEEDLFMVFSVFGGIALVILGLVCIGVLWTSGLYALEAYYAPKWFLIEQAAGLMK